MGEENTKVKAEVFISHAEYSRMKRIVPRQSAKAK
jgi:hypothetical protein